MTYSYVSPSGAISSAVIATGNANLEINEVINANAVNQQIVACNIPTANLQSVTFVAPVAMTIYINAPSTGAPSQTISLTPGMPFTWFYGNGANPITTAITTVYVTSTLGGILNIRALYNS